MKPPNEWLEHKWCRICKETTPHLYVRTTYRERENDYWAVFDVNCRICNAHEETAIRKQELKGF